MIITVDGPAGAGKSTVSRRLAHELKLTYLNSGFIYRAVTVLVLESGGEFEDRELVERIISELDLRFVDEPERTRVFVGGREITGRLKAPDVTPQVFRIANDGGYRRLLVDSQRRFAAGPGVVAEGRDMGTVIFPEADFKIYLDASVEERARRALGDLRRAGHEKQLDQVVREIEERDRHDREREHAPLVIPEGSTVVATDGMSVEEVVATLVRLVRSSGTSPTGGAAPETLVSGAPRRRRARPEDGPAAGRRPVDAPPGDRAPTDHPNDLPPREEDLGRLSVYSAVRFVAGLLIRRLLRGRCHGVERIPATGPVILASTHQSFLDPILTAVVTPRPQCFLARDTLFRVPGFGWLIRKLGAVPIQRAGASAREGLRICTQVLARDRVLVMFPEGTRSRDGRLQPLKSGVAFVARRSGAPVVPALTVGTFAAWPRHHRLPRIAAVSLHVGRPLVYEKNESFDSFTERLASAYRDLAREAGAEYLLGGESGPGADPVSSPTDVESPPAAEGDDASLRATHCFSQV